MGACVPSHVLRYHDVLPREQGPNCWNLALVMQQILPNLRQVSEDEMNFYARPPLCKELKNTDNIPPGAMGAMRFVDKNGISKEIHGFIHITDDLVYSKNGYVSSAPFKLQKTSDVLKEYFDQGDLKEIAYCDDKHLKNCKTAKYFSCDSMENYLKKNPKLESSFKKIHIGMNVLESCLEKVGMNSVQNIPAFDNFIKDILTVIEKEYDSETRDLNLLDDNDKLFILGSLKLAINSVADELQYTAFDFDSPQQEKRISLIEAFSKKLEINIKTRCLSCYILGPPKGCGWDEDCTIGFWQKYDETIGSLACEKLSSQRGYMCDRSDFYLPN
jgi:hypothetical protein